MPNTFNINFKQGQSIGIRDKVRIRLFGRSSNFLVDKAMKGIDSSEQPDAQAICKVIVNSDRNHPYSLQFKTRDHARKYKRILKEEDHFEAVYIIKQESTSEGCYYIRNKNLLGEATMVLDINFLYFGQLIQIQRCDMRINDENQHKLIAIFSALRYNFIKITMNGGL